MLLNASQKQPHYKVGIYGGPGTGKTRAAATAPDPFFILTEKHGMETVRSACAEMGVPMHPVFWCTRLEQASRIVRALATNGDDPLVQIMLDEDIVTDEDLDRASREAEYEITRAHLVKALAFEKPKTVVIDSITELVDMIASDIDDNGGKEVQEGLEGRKLRAYGPINDRSLKVIRRCRDLPYHVVFTALENSRNLGSKKEPVIRIEPALIGKGLPVKLASCVNALGRMRIKRVPFKDEGGKSRLKIKRAVQFGLPDQYVSKTASALREMEPPDVSAWFDAMATGAKANGETMSEGVEDPNADEAGPEVVMEDSE